MDKGISCIALTNTHLFTAAFDFTVIAWDISVSDNNALLFVHFDVNYEMCTSFFFVCVYVYRTFHQLAYSTIFGCCISLPVLKVLY